MSSLYSLCPHSNGLKLKLVLTKIVVQVHTHTPVPPLGRDPEASGKLQLELL